ncbi:hypothetical protein [Gloeocapsopsis crepidinum]|uniref:hypothetical protein n=1 Tax=Gloeocapsopsis crepidinum TaxID=693223 RepID=UPI003F6ECB21
MNNIDELRYFRFATTIADIPVLISRIGYTGELGYELFVHPDNGNTLWDALITRRRTARTNPCGNASTRSRPN